MTRVRIPNEGEKITRRPLSGTRVYLAVRSVHRRMMGYDPRFEAELRDLVGDAYVPVGRVSRGTRGDVLEAAQALASKRGWIVDDKRLGWATYDAAYERGLVEDAEANCIALATRVSRMQTAARKVPPYQPPPPPPLLFTEFVAEMHEILREATAEASFRETIALDAKGRDISLYYGDLMQRLEGAIDLVNARIADRGGRL